MDRSCWLTMVNVWLIVVVPHSRPWWLAMADVDPWGHDSSWGLQRSTLSMSLVWPPPKSPKVMVMLLRSQIQSVPRAKPGRATCLASHLRELQFQSALTEKTIPTHLHNHIHSVLLLKFSDDQDAYQQMISMNSANMCKLSASQRCLGQKFRQITTEQWSLIKLKPSETSFQIGLRPISFHHGLRTPGNKRINIREYKKSMACQMDHQGLSTAGISTSCVFHIQ